MSNTLWIRKNGGTNDPPEPGDQVGLRVDGAGNIVVVEKGHAPRVLGEGPGGAHPNVAAHEAMGLAADDHTHDTSHDHDPAGAHPDAAAHEALGLAANDHDHDADYSATAHGHIDYADIDHAHGYADAVHGHAVADTTGLQASLDGKAADDHTHVLTDPDIPAGIARDAEVTSAIATHAGTPHGAEAFAVGSGFITFVDTNPASLLGYGTWASRGAGRVLVGVDAGQSGGDLLGTATHGHTVTQPDAHAALTHSGATVGNHAVTQPSAHADHTLSGAIAGEASHTHTYTQTVNHVHVENGPSAATGGLVGWAPDTSTNTSVASGYSTANPTGGVAQGTTAAGSSHLHGNGTLAVSAHAAHTGAAVDAHTVGQASQHGAQSHTGTAVASSSHLPPAIAVYLWERTA